MIGIMMFTTTTTTTTTTGTHTFVCCKAFWDSHNTRLLKYTPSFALQAHFRSTTNNHLHRVKNVSGSFIGSVNVSFTYEVLLTFSCSLLS